MKRIIKSLSSAQIIMITFLLVILFGSFLLSLPISSATGRSVPYIDALFTATTSTCVTGLVTLPVATTWSFFGQVVILILIQIGGLGVITVCVGFMILLKKKIKIDDRILISDSFNLNSLSGIVKLVKKVIAITFIIETLGALSYMTVFIPEFGVKGIWISVFNSVSAFCNAGIDIIGENSLCNYVLNPVVNITTMFLIILGGIGFLVYIDFEKIIRSKNRKSLRFLTLHSKVVLCATGILIVFGTILIMLFEYSNPDTIGGYSFFEKLMVSCFQSVTTRTAGFATVIQENLTNASSFISMVLMFVGGSPVGTAGGIKTTTLLVLSICALSVIKNKRTTDIFNRQISVDIIKKSIAVAATSIFITLSSTVLLLYFSGAGFIDVLYETISATATVGLTRNFTASLDTIGKMIIIMTMYFGRIGPITLAFAFGVNKSKENMIENPFEEITIG